MANSKATREEREYVLGTDRAELDRLRFQHEAWVVLAHRIWADAGIRAGQVSIDLGAGPGFTTFDLALVVGPRGRLIAREISPRFLEYLSAERERRGLAQIEPSLGAIEELALAPDTLDSAYARWLFCWLRDPGLALERVARGLKRGGVIALQEYLDWAAMKLVPTSEPFERGVAACMRSWSESGGTIDISRRLPSLAAESGLEVELLRPISRSGRVGSLEWRWMEQFFASYLPKLVEQGRFPRADLEACLDDWRRRNESGTSWCVTPTMADVILRRR